MLLFSPPRCDFLTGNKSGKQTSFTSRRFSNPLWPSSSVSIPISPRTLKQKSTRPSPSRRAEPRSKSAPPSNMSHPPGTPRSSNFWPTLGSIPEVFEYESLNAKAEPTKPSDVSEKYEAFHPEASNMSPPTLTRTTSWPAIIESPSQKVASPSAVSKALRRILEADRTRRRRIMKIYLKAIVFLKYLWRANERYGNVMVTTGMYMQR